jgi:microsomal dipeptidase-like Zn-dependent dipeptidase
MTIRDGAELTGFADLHVHQFADLAFGGHVLWGSAAGDAAEALSSCRTEHGPHGIFDWIGNISRVTYTGAPWTALFGHDTHGYRSFSGWPSWDNYTHQAVHEQWLKRAVDGGLRLIVAVALNNEVLCRISRRGQAIRHPFSATRGDAGGCRDMDSVDLQIQAAYEMQDRVDNAAGGPGQGWYRVVGSPDEAQSAIAAGKLAVVLGIEVDHVFGGYQDGDLTPTALTAMVDRYYQAGVRHVIPLHFADNAFGGAAFALPLQWSASRRWLSPTNPTLTLPVYRMQTSVRDGGYQYRAGNCNQRGLTPLGRQLVEEMMSRGMIIDVDHMSAQTRSDVLDIVGPAGVPVVASHTEFIELGRPDQRSERQLTPAEVERIAAVGGAVAPLLRQTTIQGATGGPGTTDTFTLACQYALAQTGAHWAGFGSDMNGFAGLPQPGQPPAATLRYPFPSPVGGGPMGPDITGDRTFNLNRDGVAHVGMLPDFIAELAAARLAQPEMAALMRSADGYVRLWDRARNGTAVP